MLIRILIIHVFSLGILAENFPSLGQSNDPLLPKELSFNLSAIDQSFYIKNSDTLYVNLNRTAPGDGSVGNPFVGLFEGLTSIENQTKATNSPGQTIAIYLVDQYYHVFFSKLGEVFSGIQNITIILSPVSLKETIEKAINETKDLFSALATNTEKNDLKKTRVNLLQERLQINVLNMSLLVLGIEFFGGDMKIAYNAPFIKPVTAYSTTIAKCFKGPACCGSTLSMQMKQSCNLKTPNCQLTRGKHYELSNSSLFKVGNDSIEGNSSGKLFLFGCVFVNITSLNSSNWVYSSLIRAVVGSSSKVSIVIIGTSFEGLYFMEGVLRTDCSKLSIETNEYLLSLFMWNTSLKDYNLYNFYDSNKDVRNSANAPSQFKVSHGFVWILNLNLSNSNDFIFIEEGKLIMNSSNFLLNQVKKFLIHIRNSEFLFGKSWFGGKPLKDSFEDGSGIIFVDQTLSEIALNEVEFQDLVLENLTSIDKNNSIAIRNCIFLNMTLGSLLRADQSNIVIFHEIMISGAKQPKKMVVESDTAIIYLNQNNSATFFRVFVEDCSLLEDSLINLALKNTIEFFNCSFLDINSTLNYYLMTFTEGNIIYMINTITISTPASSLQCNNQFKLRNSTFIFMNFPQTDDAAGFSLEQGNIFEAVQVKFFKNQIYSYCGLIWASSANVLTFVSMEMEDTYTDFYGCLGYFNFNNSLSLANSDFKRLDSRLDAGLANLFLENSFSINQTFFNDINSNNGNGGLIYLEESNNISINLCYLNRFSAWGSGGVIYSARYNIISLQNFQAEEGIAMFGGVLYLSQSSEFYVYRCNFTQVSSIRSGGVLFSQNNSIVLMNYCNFLHTSAGLAGGVLYLDQSNIFNLSSSLIDDALSEGQAGGAFTFNYANEIVIQDSRFINTSSAVDAGTLFITNSNKLYYRNNSINFSNSGWEGGAISLGDENEANFVDCEFLHIYSENKGGTIFLEDSNLIQFTNCSFVNSTGIDGGGVFYFRSNNTVIFVSIVIKDCTSEYDSMILYANNKNYIFFLALNLTNVVAEESKQSSQFNFYMSYESSLKNQKASLIQSKSLIYLSSNNSLFLYNTSIQDLTGEAFIIADESQLQLLSTTFRNITMSSAVLANYFLNESKIDPIKLKILNVTFAEINSEVTLFLAGTSAYLEKINFFTAQPTSMLFLKVFDSDPCTIVSSRFLNTKNDAKTPKTHYGGFLEAHNSFLRVKRTEFINGRGIYGGAIFTEGSVLLVRKSMFFGNRASLYGGAIHCNLTANNRLEDKNVRSRLKQEQKKLINHYVVIGRTIGLGNFGERGGGFASLFNSAQYDDLMKNSSTNGSIDGNSTPEVVQAWMSDEILYNASNASEKEINFSEIAESGPFESVYDDGLDEFERNIEENFEGETYAEAEESQVIRDFEEQEDEDEQEVNGTIENKLNISILSIKTIFSKNMFTFNKANKTGGVFHFLNLGDIDFINNRMTQNSVNTSLSHGKGGAIAVFTDFGSTDNNRNIANLSIKFNLSSNKIRQNRAFIGGAIYWKGAPLNPEPLAPHSHQNKATAYGNFLASNVQSFAVFSGNVSNVVINILDLNMTQEVLIDNLVSGKNYTSCLGFLIPMDYYQQEAERSGEEFPKIMNNTLYFSLNKSLSYYCINGLLIRKRRNVTYEEFTITYDQTLFLKAKPLNFKLNFRSCMMGERLTEDLRCVECLPNSYSFNRIFKDTATETCKKCDNENFNCYGGAKLTPKPGYWRISNESENFLQCPSDDACLGDIGSDCTKANFTYSSDTELLERCRASYNNSLATGACLEGYEGNLCSKCSVGYGKSIYDPWKCSKCGNGASMFVLFLITVGKALFIAWVIKQAIQMCITISSENVEINKVITTNLIKIFINHFQTLSLIFAMPIRWSLNLGSLQTIPFLVSSPLGGGIISLYCVLRSSFPSYFQDHPLHFFKLIMIWIYPIFLLFIYLIFFRLYAKYSKDNDIKELYKLSCFNFFRKLFQPFCFLIMMIFYCEAIQITLQTFSCVNIGYSAHPYYVMRQDLSLKCWIDPHYTHAFKIALPFGVLFGLCLPLYVIIRLTKMFKNGALDRKNVLFQFGYFYYGLEPHIFYWDFLILLRKTSIIALGIFLFSNLHDQGNYILFIGFLIVSTALYVQLYFKPYRRDKINVINHVEFKSLIALVGSTFSCIFALELEEENNGMSYPVLIIGVVVLNLYFMIYWGKAFIRHNLKFVYKAMREFFQRHFQKYSERLARKTGLFIPLEILAQLDGLNTENNQVSIRRKREKTRVGAFLLDTSQNENPKKNAEMVEAPRGLILDVKMLNVDSLEFRNDLKSGGEMARISQYSPGDGSNSSKRRGGKTLDPQEKKYIKKRLLFDSSEFDGISIDSFKLNTFSRKSEAFILEKNDESLSARDKLMAKSLKISLETVPPNNEILTIKLTVMNENSIDLKEVKLSIQSCKEIEFSFIPPELHGGIKANSQEQIEISIKFLSIPFTLATAKLEISLSDSMRILRFPIPHTLNKYLEYISTPVKIFKKTWKMLCGRAAVLGPFDNDNLLFGNKEELNGLLQGKMVEYEVPYYRREGTKRKEKFGCYFCFIPRQRKYMMKIKSLEKSTEFEFLSLDVEGPKHDQWQDFYLYEIITYMLIKD